MEHKYTRKAIMFLDGEKKWFMQAYEIACNGYVIGGVTVEGHVGKNDAKLTWHIGDQEYDSQESFRSAHEATHS